MKHRTYVPVSGLNMKTLECNLERLAGDGEVRPIVFDKKAYTTSEDLGEQFIEQCNNMRGELIICSHSFGNEIVRAAIPRLSKNVRGIACIASSPVGIGRYEYALRPEMLKFAIRRIPAFFTGELVSMTREELIDVCGMDPETVASMPQEAVDQWSESGFVLRDAIFGKQIFVPEEIFGERLLTYYKKIFGEQSFLPAETDVSVPTMMFHGKEDRIVPWHLAQATAELLGHPIKFVEGLEHLLIHDPNMPDNHPTHQLFAGIVEWAREVVPDPPQVPVMSVEKPLLERLKQWFRKLYRNVRYS